MEWYWLKLALVSVVIFAYYFQLATAYDDVPCDAKEVSNRSVICRCNATYCDTLIREQPADGEVITYTSSDSGLRFHKQSYSFEDSDGYTSGVTYVLDPETKYQTINGFGGAISDAVGINWQNLTDPQLKQNLINSYCSDVGIQYNMMRVPIGGSDFSLEAYAYNEYPPDDKKLRNFSLSNEDYIYKLPFIKACMAVAPEKIDVIGSCWSSPTWMKVLQKETGVNFLKPKYYETFANYHVKFVDEYEKAGVPIWGLTTGNEPMTNLAHYASFNSLSWTVPTMASWIAEYLGPTLKEKYPEIKLVGVDDERSFISLWLNMVAESNSNVTKYLDGIGVHFYFNRYDTAQTIPLTLETFPNLFALSTEASFGSGVDLAVDWGSWDRAAYYAKDIIDNLNVGVIGWMDWNMVLNSEGGPTYANDFCDSPIIAMPEEGAFYKQPMFYSLGHFAKFLSRGSRVIKLTASDTSATVDSVAAVTPNNTIVVVLNNLETSEVQAIFRLGDKQVKIPLPPRSIVTAEFASNSYKCTTPGNLVNGKNPLKFASKFTYSKEYNNDVSDSFSSYCSDVGIQYSMIRMPIGGTDYSTRTYAYNEYPIDDKDLSNFSLSYEDYAYKLPFIKACMAVAPEEIHIVGACWSPPTWMKVFHTYAGVNFLRPTYYQSYADYHVKFVDECKKEGVHIWGLTTGNEPMINLANLGPINSLGWTVSAMADWIADYFGPTLKKHYPDIKLLGVDDQRPLIPLWLNMGASYRSDMIDYLDGVAVHFYLNNYDSPETIPLALKDYPNFFALSTEAFFGGTVKVDLGSWDRAASYAKDIIENLNVNVIGWLDWNMALNSEGGPAWNSNFCDSPIIVKPEEGAFYKQPMFYSLGHFAKFLTRGSQRIKVTSLETSATVYSVAALTPENTIVVVLNNWETYEIKATLRLRDKAVKIIVPPRSIVTSEFTLPL